MLLKKIREFELQNKHSQIVRHKTVDGKAQSNIASPSTTTTTTTGTERKQSKSEVPEKFKKENKSLNDTSSSSTLEEETKTVLAKEQERAKAERDAIRDKLDAKASLGKCSEEGKCTQGNWVFREHVHLHIQCETRATDTNVSVSSSSSSTFARKSISKHHFVHLKCWQKCEVKESDPCPILSCGGRVFSVASFTRDGRRRWILEPFTTTNRCDVPHSNEEFTSSTETEETKDLDEYTNKEERSSSSSSTSITPETKDTITSETKDTTQIKESSGDHANTNIKNMRVNIDRSHTHCPPMFKTRREHLLAKKLAVKKKRAESRRMRKLKNNTTQSAKLSVTHTTLVSQLEHPLGEDKLETLPGRILPIPLPSLLVVEPSAGMVCHSPSLEFKTHVEMQPKRPIKMSLVQFHQDVSL